MFCEIGKMDRESLFEVRLFDPCKLIKVAAKDMGCFAKSKFLGS